MPAPLGPSRPTHLAAADAQRDVAQHDALVVALADRHDCKSIGHARRLVFAIAFDKVDLAHCCFF